jgi:hypothetical protein
VRYTQVPLGTFKSIQVNAGVILNDFTPATGSYTRGNIIGATTGGNSFNSNPTYSDWYADIDNVPNNTKQGKHIESYDPALSTTFVTMNTPLGKKLVAAADMDTSDETHIIPRNVLEDGDFEDIWLVGDYSDKTGNSNGGFVAIHVKNALNTGGFQFQSTKNGKGQFSADFHGHYDIEDIDDVPFELYIKEGTAESSITITAQPVSMNVQVGADATFSVTATSSTGTLTYQWQVRGSGDSGYSNISGATSASYTESSVTTDVAGNDYRCKLSNGTDTIYSNSAHLTVRQGA